MDKPKLQNFADYRDFLKAWYDYKKATTDFWSYGIWIRKLGIKTKSALTMIVNKQRHMGKNMIPKFIDYFEFSKEDAEYFEEMIRIAKATKGDPKLTVFLMQSNEQKGKKKDRELVFQWLAYAMREMANLEDFEFHEDWYENRLREFVPLENLKKMKQRLIDDGFVDKKGAPANSIRPKGDVSKEDAIAYHKELMELSAEAVNLDIKKRALHASTLSVRKEKIDEAKKLIRDFQVKFSELMEEVPGEEVYQLNMQFFPITKE